MYRRYIIRRVQSVPMKILLGCSKSLYRRYMIVVRFLRICTKYTSFGKFLASIVSSRLKATSEEDIWKNKTNKKSKQKILNF